jgi:predicted CopG family antitoxin
VYIFQAIYMQRKLTITIEESVYNGLYSIAGKRNISRFIESLVRPHLPSVNLEEGYRAMAMDEEREREALEWSEATIGDVANETR